MLKQLKIERDLHDKLIETAKWIQSAPMYVSGNTLYNLGEILTDLFDEDDSTQDVDLGILHRIRLVDGQLIATVIDGHSVELIC